MNEIPETSNLEPRTSNLEHPTSHVARRTPHVHSASALVALALLVGLAYGNSLQNGFALDDRIIIVENKLLTKLDTLPVLLLDDYWLVRLNPYGDPPFFSGLYRPLTMASYAMNYAIGGLQPVGFHLVNVLLHLLVSWLVYLVARQLRFSPEPALVAAAVFAVHPLHTEAVANVVGRAELLMALGVLSSLWLAGRGQRTLSLAAFVVGLLSKEQAMMLPLLLVLVDLCSHERFLDSPNRQITRSQNQQILRSLASRYGGYVLVLLLFLLLRNYALGGRLIAHVGFLENPAAYVDSWTRLLTAVKVAGTYLGLCVWPMALSADYSYDAIPTIQSLLDPYLMASLLAWGSLLGLALWSLVRGDRRVTVSIGFTLITFMPVSNLLMPIGTLMGERLFYLPSVGLCLLLGLGYEHIMSMNWVRRATCDVRRSSFIGPRSSFILRLVFVALCVAMTARTAARNRDWVNSEMVFRSAVQVVPNSAKAHVALGDELKAKPSREARQQALDAYQTAVRIYPEYLFKEPKLAESLVQLRKELSTERGAMNDGR